MIDVPADVFAGLCALILVGVWVWFAWLLISPRGRSSSSRPRGGQS